MDEKKSKTDKDDSVKKEKWKWLKAIAAFFGIKITRHNRYPIQLTKRFLLWILVGIIITIVTSIGMYNYSTNPSFCNSCHIMEPYYNAWHESKHGNVASCVDCHYPPATNFAEHLWHKFQATSQVVKYVTQTYSSKPFATVGLYQLSYTS